MDFDADFFLPSDLLGGTSPSNKNGNDMPDEEILLSRKAPAENSRSSQSL